jgi:hypothetical protein
MYIIFKTLILKYKYIEIYYTQMIFNFLTKHPNSNGMGYFKHLFYSLKFALMLFFASLKAVIHALLPFLFSTSTSDVIRDISKIQKSIGCKKKKVRFRV